MTEADVIATTTKPASRETLRVELAGLGVRPGMTLLVHSSLSGLGWVCGGPIAVIHALLDAVGDDGTLVMPTHSTDLSDPAFWRNPPVPTDWWPTIRATMPPFDPDETPSRFMGNIPETFRTMPQVLRSLHPQVSFAARGPNAAQITANHQVNFGLGDGSPLARVYELDGHVLLLGVGHQRNTSLHLAEYRMDPRVGKRLLNGAPVIRDGHRKWIQIEDIELHDGDFEAVGQAARRTLEAYRTVRVAQGEGHLMPQRELVDFATRWFEQHR